MSENSTAAVLWLMIMLVFLPIAAAHVVARVVALHADQTTVGTLDPNPGQASGPKGS